MYNAIFDKERERATGTGEKRNRQNLFKYANVVYAWCQRARMGDMNLVCMEWMGDFGAHWQQEQQEKQNSKTTTTTGKKTLWRHAMLTLFFFMYARPFCWAHLCYHNFFIFLPHSLSATFPLSFWPFSCLHVGNWGKEKGFSCCFQNESSSWTTQIFPLHIYTGW